MAQSYDPVAQIERADQRHRTGHADHDSARTHSLHSCPMAAHGVEAPGVLWFLSGNETEKVEAVKTIQRVNLCFR